MKSSGFVAGTLVDTFQGLRPIETVKVGDLVLSKPEHGGEQAYKRVIRAFAHPPTRVVRVVYFREGARERSSFIDTTLEHPFWVEGKGWTEARYLEPSFVENKLLELKDGSHMIMFAVASVFPTETPNIGWISSFANARDIMGYEWDFERQKLHRSNVPAMEDIQFDDDPPPLEVPTYNLDVDEFHTYYVGVQGVWVHNDFSAG